MILNGIYKQTEPEQSVKTNNYLIYLLDQSVSLKKLTVDVQKARRNKNGSIAGESYYTQYENIHQKASDFTWTKTTII